MNVFEETEHYLDLLDEQATKTSLVKNAAMAIHILRKTIDIRNDTREIFEIGDDVSICKQAIDCIWEDINYGVYLKDLSSVLFLQIHSSVVSLHDFFFFVS